MHANAVIDAIGWIGALLILVAYAAVSTKRLEGHSTAYQLLNLAGALLLIVNTVYYGAYPSSVVNLAWVGIAVYTLARHRAKPAAAAPEPPRDAHTGGAG